MTIWAWGSGRALASSAQLRCIEDTTGQRFPTDDLTVLESDLATELR
ncbi:hypothetical protein LAJ19_20465 (plasmid) [Deinococcus taeanensis]|nr:hypothetical protein [Deinococcus taeanensis]UBV45184.1 hypothetical protein LAJ19_20465 [Deinococcus taeanensis]